MREIDKIMIGCLIFIFIVITAIYIYHRIKYSKSNYGKFEYYLDGKTSITTIIIVYEILMFFILAISITVSFGCLISKLF